MIGELWIVEEPTIRGFAHHCASSNVECCIVTRLLPSTSDLDAISSFRVFLDPIDHMAGILSSMEICTVLVHVFHCGEPTGAGWVVAVVVVIVTPFNAGAFTHCSCGTGGRASAHPQKLHTPSWRRMPNLGAGEDGGLVRSVARVVSAIAQW